MSYVTAQGFERKTLQEIRRDIEQRLKQVFGQDFDTSVDSPNGLLIGQLSLSFSNLWELAQDVYNSRDPAQATGVSLDFAAALNGLFRQAPTPCRVTAVVYTEVTSSDTTTTVPAGEIATRSRGGLEFALDSPVTIQTSSCKEIFIQDDGSRKGVEYVFHFSFGDITLDNDTSASNLEVLKGLILAEGVVAEIVRGNNLRIYMANGENIGYVGQVPDSDFLLFAGNPGNFTATETGSQTCEVGELDEIDGDRRVYNPTAGIPGTDTETDTHLRIRRAAAATAFKGKGTDEAVEAHLMEDVVGVTSAKVKSNRQMTTDSNGIPPKSFRTLVVGGEDYEVAKCILDNQASGIESYGNTSVAVTDGNGDQQIVSFSRPTAVCLWVKISYKVYDEEQQSSDDEIKAALIDWASREYQLGKDVIPSRVLQGLYGVSGIGEATPEVAVTAEATDTPTYGTTTIPVAATEYAVLTASRITLVEVT